VLLAVQHATWEQVQACAENLERRFPTASLVLWIGVTSRDRAFAFASRGGAIGICS
jgi:hypothetical protein